MLIGGCSHVALRTQAIAVAISSVVLAGSAAAAPPAPGSITEFTVPTAGSQPIQLVTGPDGALWFTEENGNKIGRITTAGVVSEFPVTTAASQPVGITAGPDGALWFTEQGGNQIARITTAGAVTEFPLPTAGSNPVIITVGPDGALWFTEVAGRIGRITTAGAITEFTVPTAGGQPIGLTAAADGNLWFSEMGANKIGRITTAGVITEFTNPNPAAAVRFITRGPNGRLFFSEAQVDSVSLIATDGTFQGEAPYPTSGGGASFIGLGPDAAVWITETQVNKLARIGSGPAGSNGPVFTEYTIPTAASNVTTFTGGPDGNLWFTEKDTNKIGRLTPNTNTTPVVAAILPSSRSVSVGATATAFATIINGGTTPLTSCGMNVLSSIPASFSFQTTNSATNALSGTPNTFVPLAAGASQSYVIAFTANAPFTPANVVLSFGCKGADPAQPYFGLNTLLLSGSATPVPDIVALSATPTSNGVLAITGTTGSGAFSVATVNVGASGAITASAAPAGSVSLPLTISICQTNPSTGACLSAAAPTASATITANATPTFSVFATASGAIANSPAVNRIAVQFTDAGGVVRGSTSVAVQAQ